MPKGNGKKKSNQNTESTQAGVSVAAAKIPIKDLVNLDDQAALIQLGFRFMQELAETGINIQEGALRIHIKGQAPEANTSTFLVNTEDQEYYFIFRYTKGAATVGFIGIASFDDDTLVRWMFKEPIPLPLSLAGKK